MGKTTLVKLEIQRLLEELPSSNVMYYSFEVEESPRDIVQIINEYLTMVKGSMERKFIFLDEVSNILNWQKALKKLKDMGRLENTTVIITGSHVIDIRQASERMPGRRGFPTDESLDKMMTPMTFRQYVCAIDADIKTKMGKMDLLDDNTTLIKDLVQGSIADEINDLEYYQNELDSHIDSYLITGGIPHAVNEYIKNKFIAETTYESHLDFISTNLNYSKDISYQEEVLPNVVESIGTPTSWNAMKKNTDISSNHTAEKTVKRLADMFVLLFFYKYDSTRDKSKFDGPKKIYFTDSLYLHGTNGRITGKDPFRTSLNYLDDPVLKSTLIEQVVANHMVKLAFDPSPRITRSPHHNSIFYWKGKKEVDFVVRDGDFLIPIEVKYQNQIKKSDLGGIIDFKKTSNTEGGLIITKHHLDAMHSATSIPASLFLLLV